MNVVSNMIHPTQYVFIIMRITYTPLLIALTTQAVYPKRMLP